VKKKLRSVDVNGETWHYAVREKKAEGGSTKTVNIYQPGNKTVFARWVVEDTKNGLYDLDLDGETQRGVSPGRVGAYIEENLIDWENFDKLEE
jgi:hypothetical protein